MILTFNVNNNDEVKTSKLDDNNISDISVIKKGKSCNNLDLSSTSVDNENVFVFDVKYSEIFKKQDSQQNDELFFEKYQNLKMTKKFKSESSLCYEDLEVSKEANFFNKDFLKILDMTDNVSLL
jgi:hypothetical protein